MVKNNFFILANLYIVNVWYSKNVQVIFYLYNLKLDSLVLGVLIQQFNLDFIHYLNLLSLNPPNSAGENNNCSMNWNTCPMSEYSTILWFAHASWMSDHRRTMHYDLYTWDEICFYMRSFDHTLYPEYVWTMWFTWVWEQHPSRFVCELLIHSLKIYLKLLICKAPTSIIRDTYGENIYFKTSRNIGLNILPVE